MPYKDPEKRRLKQQEYSRKYYERNRSLIIKKSRIARKKLANKFKEYKSTKFCAKCGESHPSTLDFHHAIHLPDNKKVFQLVADGHSWRRIMKEIAKCIVLCSNCHRKVHHEERLTRSSQSHKKTNLTE